MFIFAVLYSVLMFFHRVRYQLRQQVTEREVVRLDENMYQPTITPAHDCDNRTPRPDTP